MKKLIYSTLVVLLTIFSLQAQNPPPGGGGGTPGGDPPVGNDVVLSISGLVSTSDGDLVDNQLLELLTTYSNETYTAYTNEDGIYEFNVSLDSNYTQGSFVLTLETETCGTYTEEGAYYPSNYDFVYDFTLCSTPPSGDCENYFTYIDNGQNYYIFEGFSTPEADEYLWDFGDGTYGEGQEVAHAFDMNQSGILTVTLTTIITDPSNGCTAVSTQDIDFGGGNPSNCENYFTYEQNGYFFLFNGFSTPEADAYIWDMGDGTILEGQEVGYLYTPNQNEYTVTLTTIVNIQNDSCVAYSSQVVILDGGNPNECENYFTYVDNGQNYYIFEGFATPEADSYSWDFGDGTYGEGQEVAHAFDMNQSGIVTVTLITTIGDSIQGCTAVSYQEIDFGGGNSGNCENYFTYVDNGQNYYIFEGFATPEADSYSWDFGDGTYGEGQEVAHAFDMNQSGVLTVTLTTIITDPSNGCTAVSTQDIDFGGGNPGNCENYFTYVDNGQNYYIFEGFATPEADSYSWDFGDGTYGEGQEVAHAFDMNQSGVLTVTLTTIITDPSNGCTAVSTQDIDFGGGNPGNCENYFTYVDNGQNYYIFEGFATPEADSYFWDFGDGTTGEGQEVGHAFDMYLNEATVTLITTLSNPNGDSCIAYSTQTIEFGGSTPAQSISGIITMDQNPADYAVVAIYGFDNSGWFLFDWTNTQQGSYYFENIPAGEYYLHAALTDESSEYLSYFPTYYEESLFWYDANVITVDSNSLQYNINLIPTGQLAPGTGTISGNITVDSKEVGSEINILIRDENNNPISYLNSNEEGEFDFSDLAFGTYKIGLEISGVDSDVATITLTADNPTVELNFTVTEEGAVLSINDIQNISFTSQIFPNPVVDKANLNLTAKKAMSININIYNQLGAIVSSQDYTVQSGMQNIQLNTTSLREGVYYLHIQSENGDLEIQKIVKTK